MVWIEAMVAGLLSFSIYLSLLLLAYVYSRKIVTPLSRRFSVMVIVSGIFAVIASTVVIYDSITGDHLWWLEASFFLISYVVLMISAINYLRLSSQLVSENKERELGTPISPTTGGFSIPRSDLAKISLLCQKFNVKIYIGRSQNPDLCRFDLRIWLSRVEAPNSVDPSKLHIILESTIRTISEKGGNGFVVLDGIEYLLLHNDFRSVVKFLTSLKDYVMLSNSVMILALDEDTLDRRELSVLRREFPELDLNKVLSTVEKRALFGALSKEDLSDAKG